MDSSGPLERLLHLLAAHAGVLHGVPVHQPHSTGSDGLRKLVHGCGSLGRRGTGCCRQVGNTLNGTDRFLQPNTGRREGTDVARHLAEVVDGLVGVDVELVQSSVDRVDVLALGGCVRQDGLNRVELKLVLLETGLGGVNGEGFDELAADTNSLGCDAAQRRNARDLHQPHVGDNIGRTGDNISESQPTSGFRNIIDALRSALKTKRGVKGLNTRLGLSDTVHELGVVELETYDSLVNGSH